VHGQDNAFIYLNGSTLRRLNVSNTAVTSVGLRTIAQRCPLLQDLEMEACLSRGLDSCHAR
jgi:hypothetical protein